MIHVLEGVSLRKPEPSDVEALYQQKNDAEVARSLGGFGFGMSRADVREWIERHRARQDEIIWIIAEHMSDRCLGHVGLYNIDYRVRSAEFAILLGEPSARGRGLGKRVTQHVVRYGFDMLNLNRVHLTLLANNERARRLYEAVGFKHEGVLRQAQYKDGTYLDVIVMSLLRADVPGLV